MSICALCGGCSLHPSPFPLRSVALLPDLPDVFLRVPREVQVQRPARLPLGDRGIGILRIDDEDLNSSTESANSTSLIHCIASVGNCEQVHTSVLNFIFQHENVAGVRNLSK